ncbi:MAG: hypothetical protein IRZ32_12180 [Solirubrobacteraceae bacterium]|nr:hypothetical protein [Solirubrobacteraceae bacterium]
MGEHDTTTTGAAARHAVPCDCAGTCTVALVTALEPAGREPQTWYVDLYQHARYRSLGDRARAAWRVLRGRDPWMHQVVLSPERLRGLRDFIDEHLERPAA